MWLDCNSQNSLGERGSAPPLPRGRGGRGVRPVSGTVNRAPFATNLEISDTSNSHVERYPGSARGLALLAKHLPRIFGMFAFMRGITPSAPALVPNIAPDRHLRR